MKFGKNIARVVELSEAEWAPYWVNYKFLKKKVKALTTQSGGKHPRLKEGNIEGRSNPEAIARSLGEIAFYKLLRQELNKCSAFFTSVEAEFVVRYQRVQEGWRRLNCPDTVIDGNPHRRVMEACVKLYRDLLLLENYAIMNYCGFSKILKKHDKVTGFLTREQFMKNVCNQAPFVHYPRLIKMLSSVEKLFKQIETFSYLPGSEMAVLAEASLSEKQLFIDTVRTMNNEAFRLQQQEGADIGLNSKEFAHKRDCLDSLPMVAESSAEEKGEGSGATRRGAGAEKGQGAGDAAHTIGGQAGMELATAVQGTQAEGGGGLDIAVAAASIVKWREATVAERAACGGVVCPGAQASDPTLGLQIFKQALEQVNMGKNPLHSPPAGVPANPAQPPVPVPPLPLSSTVQKTVEAVAAQDGATRKRLRAI